MAIYRASTPTFTFKFKIDLSQMSKIQLTFSQNDNVILEKQKTDLTILSDNKSFTYELTQDEANLFETGVCEAQVRFLTNDGKSFPSKIVKIIIEDVLHDNVLVLSS